jgi:glyoxylase-like metal-dependent hydrolase (beta-lactamase superfamily II)
MIAALFSGDHVMGWSTTVINPPLGNMIDYMESLEKVRARSEDTYYPTHGPPINGAQEFVEELIEHRLEREAQIKVFFEMNGEENSQLRALAPADLVPTLYAEVPAHLHPMAARSVLAHMQRLEHLGYLESVDGGRRFIIKVT